MPQSAQDIVTAINAHMANSNLPNLRWYVGITNDIEKRLHGDHQVPKKDHWFIWREAYSSADARAVENAYFDAGCKGAPGGGDRDSVFVYAYVITSNTVE